MDYPSDPAVGLVAGKFTDGNAAGGVPASLDRAAEMNAVYDELLALIAGSGQTADEATLNQILKAVKRFAGGSVTTLSADATLTLDQAGLVLVDATAGNVTVTLPSAADLAALPFTIIRVDGSANTVTLAAAATEAVGGAASITLLQGDIRKVKSDGVNEFHLEADNQVATQAETDAGTDDRKPITAKKLRWGFSASFGTSGYIVFPSWLGGWVVQWGNAVISGSNVYNNVTLPLTFPNAFLVALGSSSSVNSYGGATVVDLSTIGLWSNNSGAGINFVAVGN